MGGVLTVRGLTVSFTYLNTRLCASLSTPVPDITHLGGGPEWR